MLARTQSHRVLSEALRANGVEASCSAVRNKPPTNKDTKMQADAHAALTALVLCLPTHTWVVWVFRSYLALGITEGWWIPQVLAGRWVRLGLDRWCLLLRPTEPRWRKRPTESR